MIAFHSVSKSVGRGADKRLLLDRVDWEIAPRAQYVILGHHGSGKSSLLRLMSGLQTPTSGWVERRAVVSIPTKYMRYGRGLRTPNQLVHRLTRVFNADEREVGRFIERFCGIRDLNLPFKLLSRQLRQRLELGLLYGLPCDYYLFDEKVPLGDATMRARCLQAYAGRRQEAGMILVTSNPRMARTFDGQGAVLYKGQLILCETVQAAIALFESLPVETFRSHHEDTEQSPQQNEEEDLFF